MSTSDTSGVHLHPLPATSAKVDRPLDGALVVPIALVVENPNQVRQTFDPEALRELAADVQERGILEPLIVRSDAEGRYEIVAGARRYRAALIAGMTDVPVVVRDFDDKAAQLAQLVENIQRQDLDPHDERVFFQHLQNEYNLSATAIAALIHKSKMYVTRRLNGDLVGLHTPEKDSEGMHKDNPSIHTAFPPQNPLGDSEEMHKDNVALRPLQKSQSRRLPSLRTSTFTRFNHTLDTTLDLLDAPIDNQTRTAIVQTLDEMEQKIAAIKAKLADQGNR